MLLKKHGKVNTCEFCIFKFIRLKEALEDFDKALKLDDKNPVIYSNIGYAHVQRDL